MDNQLFRQKSLDHISSPEELHDYMRVTSPRLWMVLAAILILVGGFIVYAATTRLESKETVRVTAANGRISGRIPAERQDLIKVGMPVRIGGQTGKINSIDNSIRYRLNIQTDSGEPPEYGYYSFAISDDIEETLDKYSEKDILWGSAECGAQGMLITNSDPEVLKTLSRGDVRVRMWKEPDDGFFTPSTPLNGAGRLATISGYSMVVTTTVDVTLDDPNGEIPDGEYDAEIITESTTPISFLWNK